MCVWCVVCVCINAINVIRSILTSWPNAAPLWACRSRPSLHRAASFGLLQKSKDKNWKEIKRLIPTQNMLSNAFYERIQKVKNQVYTPTHQCRVWISSQTSLPHRALLWSFRLWSPTASCWVCLHDLATSRAALACAQCPFPFFLKKKEKLTVSVGQNEENKWMQNYCGHFVLVIFAFVFFSTFNPYLCYPILKFVLVLDPQVFLW